MPSHRSHPIPPLSKPTGSWVRREQRVNEKERRKREKIGEIMREEREIPGLKSLESIKFFFIPFSYSTILKDGIVALCQKNLTFPKFSLPIAEHFLPLNARCILHLAYDRPTVDALRSHENMRSLRS